MKRSFTKDNAVLENKWKNVPYIIINQIKPFVLEREGWAILEGESKLVAKATV